MKVLIVESRAKQAGNAMQEWAQTEGVTHTAHVQDAEQALIALTARPDYTHVVIDGVSHDRHTAVGILRPTDD
ncbi:MAG: hypothetical protein AB203_00850 [Parcubacteria bacterium C7867-008]|nr:MAG: hypothetical protein AB203_00850 [Parcubacteria bacterium C7867-008]